MRNTTQTFLLMGNLRLASTLALQTIEFVKQNQQD